jgi:serine kinase of HPr protein (carbohydrate metabolism regulator)
LKRAQELVHGTCVALGAKAALLRGRSGAGKSDLALRFIALPTEPGLEPRLVADDQVVVEARGRRELIVSPPATLAGKLEVRGLGILEILHLAQARLVLAIDLVPPEEVPRMPAEPSENTVIAGVAVPLLRLAPFEPSSALKLKLALLAASLQMPIRHS